MTDKMCGEQWLETGNPFAVEMSVESQLEYLKAENERLTKQNEQLIRDLHRIDSARQAAVGLAQSMAELINGEESMAMLAQQLNGGNL